MMSICVLYYLGYYPFIVFQDIIIVNLNIQQIVIKYNLTIFTHFLMLRQMIIYTIPFSESIYKKNVCELLSANAQEKSVTPIYSLQF